MDGWIFAVQMRSGVEAMSDPARDEQEDAAHHRRCPGPEDPRVVRGDAGQRCDDEHHDRCRDLAFRGSAFGLLFVAGDHDEAGDGGVEEIPQGEGVPHKSVRPLPAPEGTGGDEGHGERGAADTAENIEHRARKVQDRLSIVTATNLVAYGNIFVQKDGFVKNIHNSKTTPDRRGSMRFDHPLNTPLSILKIRSFASFHTPRQTPLKIYAEPPQLRTSAINP